MKLTHFNTRLVELPLAKPIGTAIHRITRLGCVILELTTAQGISGESYAFTLNGVRLRALEETLLSFASRVHGRDPHFVTQLGQEIYAEINPIGHAGFPIAALAAIDTACWDIIGKAAGQPLYKLFGACRDKVKTYASGGLWLSQSIDECVLEAADFIEAGFRSMKLRLGSRNLANDIARVRALREAVGDDIELLVDVNQGLSVQAAIRLGRALEPFDLGWFEEPVAYHNLHGHAEVRRAVNIPLASGETAYTHLGMHALLKAGAVDVLMPDLQRVGGLSEFRRSAALAAAYHVPVSTHLFTEQSLCLAASEPNCLSVEFMPWFAPLYNETLAVVDGYLQLPNRPGIGFTFNQSALRRLRPT